MQSDRTRQIFHFPAAAVCVSEHVQEVSHFCGVQEVKKVGVAGLPETVKSRL